MGNGGILDKGNCIEVSKGILKVKEILNFDCGGSYKSLYIY